MEAWKQSKKKITLAIAASILFHVLLLLFLAFWIDARASQPPIPPPDANKPLEITIVPDVTPPTIAVAPTPPPERENIRSDDLTPASTPPPDTAFESDRDTAAGGSQPGSGPKNMPNVQGRASGEITLRDQQVSLGKTNGAPPPDTPKTADKSPTPKPTPQPPQIVKVEPSPPPTPEPALEDSIAIGRSTPTPQPTAAPLLSKPAPGGQAYQPETRATRIEGSLSNRGRPSVAARGTPLGRYLRQVENAIGSRWYFYIKRDAAFVAPGSVRIIFKIDKSGKASDLRILSNSSNESFASTSTQSIMDAEFPPIPDDVASTLFTQRLELPFTFTIY